jgi:hypothetical protein
MLSYVRISRVFASKISSLNSWYIRYSLLTLSVGSPRESAGYWIPYPPPPPPIDLRENITALSIALIFLDDFIVTLRVCFV